MGFQVAANDREYYSALIARCRVVLDSRRLEAAFDAEGGAAHAFNALDAFARGDEEAAGDALRGMPSAAARRRWSAAFEGASAAEPYLARHYAPARTEAADWRAERLFYTAENARFLDRARDAVELLYPVDPMDPEADPAAADAKAAFLDALLYEAATRVNTSGVFKACHRGFGGHGKDALLRIASPMRLLPPDLVPGPEGEASAADAAVFCAGRPADIAYLDPPYNQHQYGSNYHLLTTIARWDRPPVSEERDGTGFLLDRSGIRPDWVRTRSEFCGRRTAVPAFESLLAAVDARFILVSYNEGGILPPAQLLELLSRRGEVRVEAVPYVAYRGGRQSATRAERTSEFLFVLDTAIPVSAQGVAAATAALRLLGAAGEMDKLRKGRFRAEPPLPDGLGARVGEDGRLSVDGEALGGASAESLEGLAVLLRERAAASNLEAFDLVFSLYRDALRRETGTDGAGRGRRPASRLGGDALSLLKKIAFRKYAADYRARSAALRAAFSAAAEDRLARKLDALDARAALRGVEIG
jgi:adenine-specific DNA-methyltransferase